MKKLQGNEQTTGLWRNSGELRQYGCMKKNGCAHTLSVQVYTCMDTLRCGLRWLLPSSAARRIFQLLWNPRVYKLRSWELYCVAPSESNRIWSNSKSPNCTYLLKIDLHLIRWNNSRASAFVWRRTEHESREGIGEEWSWIEAGNKKGAPPQIWSFCKSASYAGYLGTNTCSCNQS